MNLKGPKSSQTTQGTKTPSPEKALVQPSAVAPAVQPSHVNEHGCLVFRDDHARQKLAEWGYPWMSGSRYPFDESLKGWEQFDTPQDASYYGVWTSVDRMAVVSYTEGDVTLVVAPDKESFQAEIRSLWDWNLAYKPDSSVHTQLDSPKLHVACLIGHPPFDRVLADYEQRKTLERQYEGLHELAYAKLEDPALPKGRFHVLNTDEHVFFLRGRVSSPRDICVAQKEGYNLNAPDHILSSTSGADASDLAVHIGLLEELVAPVDRVLASKIHGMQRGEQAVLSDKECDTIAELDADWTGRFATLHNPARVGVLDAWVGFIKTRETP